MEKWWPEAKVNVVNFLWVNWEINPATNRAKHGQRRHQILAIAGQLVASEGLEGLKMPVISRELGISTPALYRHFPSKESLVAELALRVMDEIHRIKESAGGALFNRI